MAVDDAEFREFFASQYARLCWLGRALTASPAQAEELAQKALVRTWWRWRLVGRPQDPASYARRVLVNRHRSLLRRAATEARSFARIGLDQAAMPAGDERAMVLLRRKVRRGRTMAAGVALALAAAVGVAGMVPRILPNQEVPPVTPAGPSSSPPKRVCGWWSRCGHEALCRHVPGGAG